MENPWKPFFQKAGAQATAKQRGNASPENLEAGSQAL